MGESIGRFGIEGELGRGAQSVVYLAFDPHLERKVAVKTLHFSGANDRQNIDLLAEARIVGQLRHPGIVPIFEAGEQDGDLYLVFEYVPGDNLARLIERQAPLPPEQAASLMAAILAAIAHAHGEGVIHRDLKPSNVLIDAEGHPRVMDFGIARRVDGGAREGEGFSGTPAYMAPEYVRARTVNAGTDIFAAGLILLEMLSGRRVFTGSDPQTIMQRVAGETISLPADVTVDERLAAIALRAVARDPVDRFRSAAEFRQALLDYLTPATETEGPRGEATRSTVEFLLRRMRHKSDFPALSESVSAINRIATDESESINKLSLTILRDFSLTNKILRLVNSAHFRQAGGGSISTISRAVLVLGFDAVRNIAITVLLFEHLQDKANAKQLKEEFLRASMAGILAKDLATQLKSRELEQAFICAVFHNLGRLLSQFYFPEESEEIRRLMAQKSLNEATAAQRVLGIGFAELGMGIARNWGFPPLIVGSMERLPEGAVRRPRSTEERLRTLSAFANDLTQAITTLAPAERDKAMRQIRQRFEDSLQIDDKTLKASLNRTIVEIADFARIIHIKLAQTETGRHLRQFAGGAIEGTATSAGDDAELADALLQPSESAGLDTGSFPAEGQKSADAQAVLTAGIQDISNTLVSDFKLNDILRIILETMYRAMGFRRVLLCIKDARSNTMQGRFGFGPEVNELAREFRFTLRFTPDIFHAATSKGVDILISDIDDEKIAERIPDWYRKASGSKTFVLFPLTIKNNPVALIYADKLHPGEIIITDKELQLLRTLRNQALLAIKQAA